MDSSLEGFSIFHRKNLSFGFSRKCSCSWGLTMMSIMMVLEQRSQFLPLPKGSPPFQQRVPNRRNASFVLSSTREYFPSSADAAPWISLLTGRAALPTPKGFHPRDDFIPAVIIPAGILQDAWGCLLLQGPGLLEIMKLFGGSSWWGGVTAGAAAWWNCSTLDRQLGRGIMEWFSLEKPSWITESSHDPALPRPPCPKCHILMDVTAGQGWGPTTALGCPFQCLTTLSMRKYPQFPA